MAGESSCQRGENGVKRGDIVTVAAPGDYGKPRPAVIVQSNFLNDTHASIMLCLLTS